MIRRHLIVVVLLMSAYGCSDGSNDADLSFTDVPLVDFNESLSVVATISLADTDLDLTTSNWSANLYSTAGGVTSVGPVTDIALTNIGDGLGHSVALSGSNFELTQLGGDYKVTVRNASTDTLKLTFGINAEHMAHSDDGGLDADGRSTSEIEVTDVSDSEHLFSRITSESGKDYFDAGNSSWQDQTHNEVSDTLLGTWGGVLSFDNLRQFEVLLTGGASSDIIGVFDVEGRTFDSGATFSATSRMILVLLSVENLSSPSNTEMARIDLAQTLLLVSGNY